MKGNVAEIDYDKYEPNEITDMMDLVLKKCPAQAIVSIGEPRPEDLQAVKDEQMPEVVKAHLETTVDKADWQG